MGATHRKSTSIEAGKRVEAAYCLGKDPSPEDLRIRDEHEAEWELSYPVAAGVYSIGDEAGVGTALM